MVGLSWSESLQLRSGNSDQLLAPGNALGLGQAVHLWNNPGRVSHSDMVGIWLPLDRIAVRSYKPGLPAPLGG